MSDIPYKAIEYGGGNSDEVVALVAGFAYKNSNLETAGSDLEIAGRALAARGWDAVVYEYHPCVLTAGDGDLLPELINTLSDDFLARTDGHAKRRFAGVSLGGGIAVNMQKKYDNPERGLFAATGVDAAELVMKNRLFQAMVRAIHHIDIVRAYQENGYTLASLRDKWRTVQEPPKTPITMALGGLDYIVNQRKMMRQIAEWRTVNPDIRVIRKPWLDHNRTIRWFSTNITSLVEAD